MFVHIGNNNTVLTEEIITILDKDTVESSKVTRDFVESFFKNNLVLNSDVEDIKTYIIVEVKDKDKKQGLYTSNISSQALYKRMNK